MASQFSSTAIFKEARSHVLSYAFFRPESAVIIGATLLGVTLCVTGFLPAHLWWVVLIGGIALEMLIVISTVKDAKFVSSVAAAKFYERYNANNLGVPELRKHAAHALDCHRQIFTSIKAHPNAPLGDVAHKTDEWVGKIYHVAHSLDTFVANPAVIERLRNLHDGANSSQLDGSESLSLILGGDNDAANANRNMDLLGDVKQAVQGATSELSASLRGMSHVRHQLNATNPASMDWSFAQELTGVIANHMVRLDDAGDLVDALFTVYTRESAA
jgi:hypothetical protein